MTYRDILQSSEEKLTAANVPDAKTDAWRLFEHFTGMSRGEYFLKQNDTLGTEQVAEYCTGSFGDAIQKRVNHVPLQHIIGTQTFFGREFKVSADTLIPRFDTEIVVEKAINEVGDYCLKTRKNVEEIKLLDMCTGTGCILISMVSELGMSCGVGTDISAGAITLAGENSDNNGTVDRTSFYRGDLFEALTGTGFNDIKFDVIVSNPPYIKSEDIKMLDTEVRDYEPGAALDGGEDGLLFYRRIVAESVGHITENGRLIFEIGCDEADDVMRIMISGGYKDIKVYKDLAGLDRVVAGTYGGYNV